MANDNPLGAPPETSAESDERFYNEQKNLKLQDIINERKLNNIQRAYVKCSFGRCPKPVREHQKSYLGMPRKKCKVNFTSIRKQDRKLSKLFISKGRIKRIEILQEEVDEIDIKLKVASGKLHTMEINDNFRLIADNLRQQEQMIEEIRVAKLEVGHIKSQLERLDRKSFELDQETEAEIPFMEHLTRANRQLEIHEKRLELSRQEEGKMLAESRRLRELLLKMLYFRSIFNRSWNDIVDKLKNRKKFLLDMIERSSTAFNQDSELSDDFRRLQYRRERDREASIKEILSMKREIDANDIIDIFLGRKGKQTRFPPLLKKEVKRRQDFKEEYTSRLNFYQSILDEIKKYPFPATDNPIKKSLNYFTTIDNDIFGYKCFRDVMHVRLEAVTAVCESAIKDFNNVHTRTEGIKNYFRTKLEEAEQTLNAEINTSMSYKMEIDKLQRSIQKYSNSLFSMMKRLRCDLTPIQRLLRKQTVMDQHNLEVYLSVLEWRLNEVIALVYCKQRGITKILLEDPKLTVRSLKHKDRKEIKLRDIVTANQCPECAQGEDTNLQDTKEAVQVLTDDEIRQIMIEKTEMSTLPRRMHTLSACHLPRSGFIASRRYAE